eukprot:gb/GECG01016157.1/.p1 GENE.gb/GECG01016157.1/~~gb/GECG01016157.1/.p1  ORF type:complete len:481 (+),score=48.21 gb/GECG01016157.1/:1-1443(+)
MDNRQIHQGKREERVVSRSPKAENGSEGSKRNVPGPPIRQLRSPNAAAASAHSPYLPNEAPIGASKSKENLAKKGLHALQSVEVVKLEETPDAPVVLLAGAGDGTIFVWNGDNAKLLVQWKGHSSGIISIQYSGGVLFTHGRDGFVRLWDWSFDSEQTAGRVPNTLAEVASCAGTFSKMSLLAHNNGSGWLFGVPPPEKTGTISIWEVTRSNNDEETVSIKTRNVLNMGTAEDTDASEGTCMGCTLLKINSLFMIISVDDGGFLQVGIFDQRKVSLPISPSAHKDSGTENWSTGLTSEGKSGLTLAVQASPCTAWRMIRKPVRKRISSRSLISVTAIPDSHEGALGASVYCGEAGPNLYRFKVSVSDTSEDNSVRISLHKQISLPTTGIGSIACRSDGKLLVCGGWDHKLWLFSGKSLKQLAVLDATHCETVGDVRFIRYFRTQRGVLRDQSVTKVDHPALFASCDQEGSLALWDVYATQ